MEPTVTIQQMKQYLHSNLVIFKYFFFFKPSHLWYKFTFQSGDIQIHKIKKEKKQLHSNMVIFEYLEKNPHITDITIFTFQSGDIQIISPVFVVLTPCIIYIPIW